jgi:flagellar protein FliS
LDYIDPYEAYVEGSVTGGGPLGLVIALYGRAIGSIQQARHHLQSGDIHGRGRAINKAADCLTELLLSLDHESGGEISRNLANLYGYIQARVIEGHSRQADQPLAEAERLLGTMLEGWNGAAERMNQEIEGFACAGVSEVF